MKLLRHPSLLFFGLFVFLAVFAVHPLSAAAGTSQESQGFSWGFSNVGWPHEIDVFQIPVYPSNNPANSTITGISGPSLVVDSQQNTFLGGVTSFTAAGNGQQAQGRVQLTVGAGNGGNGYYECYFQICKINYTSTWQCNPPPASGFVSSDTGNAFQCSSNTIKQKYIEYSQDPTTCIVTSTTTWENPTLNQQAFNVLKCSGADKKVDDNGTPNDPSDDTCQCAGTQTSQNSNQQCSDPFTLSATTPTYSCNTSYLNSNAGSCLTQNRTTTQDCGGCVAPTGPNTIRCSGRYIQTELDCGLCTGTACANTVTWQNAIDCGVAQNVNYQYCAGGISYTINASFPGSCVANNVGNWVCQAPQVTITPNGQCNGNGGGGGIGAPGGPVVGGHCDTVGAQEQCDGGGVSTCQQDNTWGSCACLAGLTSPFTQCAGQKCISNKNACGISNCNACAASTTCNNQRQCVLGGGGASCTAAGDCANLSMKCNAQQQCVPGGTGGSCANDAACVAQSFTCNNQSQCVPGGGGSSCNISNGDSDCNNGQAYGCNAQQQCVLGGTSGSCNINNGNNDCVVTCPSGQVNPHLNCQGGTCTSVTGCGVSNCSTQGQACVNTVPYVDFMSANESDCVAIAGQSLVSYNFTYKDDEGDNQQSFVFQIATDQAFQHIVYSKTVLSSCNPSNQDCTNAVSVPVKTDAMTDGCNVDLGDSCYIQYAGTQNTHYYVRARVIAATGANDLAKWFYYEANGQVSTNSASAAVFNTAVQPNPYPSFTFSPSSPKVADTVDFTDYSVCYNNQLQQFACTGVGNYTWTYGGEGTSNANQPPYAHAFQTGGSKNVNLQVCQSGNCCAYSATVPVQSPTKGNLPNYKEISPF